MRGWGLILGIAFTFESIATLEIFELLQILQNVYAAFVFAPGGYPASCGGRSADDFELRAQRRPVGAWQPPHTKRCHLSWRLNMHIVSHQPL